MAERIPERLRKRREEEIQRASRVIFESENNQFLAPQINGKLRSFALRVPEQINKCSGIVINGKRIRSLVFTTDVAIIRNVDADAVFAVYPYTPQPIITDMLVHAADIPVYALCARPLISPSSSRLSHRTALRSASAPARR